ncbi:MAG: hypothetical protein WC100_01645 [Sterolibacterium sp.]
MAVSYSGVPEEQLSGQAMPGFSVRANADSMGAQIGQATQRIAAQAEDLTVKYGEQAAEARANDLIANHWAPKVSKMTNDYQQKQGMDALSGFAPLQEGLKQSQSELLAQAKSPYERAILSKYTSNRTMQEMDAAQRHQSTQLTAYEDKSHDAFVNTLSDNAVTNYNDPYVVDSSQAQLFGQIEKHALDRGVEPDSPIIAEQQRTAWGKTVGAMVNRATLTGDIHEANRIYSQNADVIPGYQRLEIDKSLHAENMKYTASRNADALLGGDPLPAPTGSVPHVQATVANVAHSQGIDPNHALTVASIESSFGQNLGKRGDIGQTGKGGDLQEQAFNMAVEIKKGDTAATKALGRKAEPWEGYACYQQGVGGGPALLKAAQADPTARAVDVLLPLYEGDRKMALSAVVNNGGNATMTSGQFLQYIKNNYDNHAKRAKCEFPRMNVLTPGITDAAATPVAITPTVPGNIDLNNRPVVKNSDGSVSTVKSVSVNIDGKEVLLPTISDDGKTMTTDEAVQNYKKTGKHLGIFNTPEEATQYAVQLHKDQEKQYAAPDTILGSTPPATIGDDIVAARDTKGVAVQPGATPMQALLNFDEVYPSALQRAQAIPNVDEREATIQALNQKRAVYQSGATAWKNKFLNDAQNLAINPTFTSIDQIPPDMRAALVDSPQTMTYLETRANYNLEKSAGVTSKDAKEYGGSFYDVFSGIHSGKINNVVELQGMVGKGLTISGYDKAVKELSGKGTPEGEAESQMKKQAFDVAKSQISGKNEMMGLRDPKGEELYLKWMQLALPAIEKGKAEGKNYTQLYNPESPDYIGKSIPMFKRSMTEMLADINNETLLGDNTAKEIKQDANGGAPAAAAPVTLSKAELADSLTAGKVKGPRGIAAIKASLRDGKITRAEANDLLIQHGYARAPTPSVQTAE